MVYPVSPFTETFNTSTIFNLNTTDTTNNSVNTNELQTHLKTLLAWLCTTPRVTSVRVNTLKFKVEDVKQLIENVLVESEKSRKSSKCIPKVSIHPLLGDVILIDSHTQTEIERKSKEAIVSEICGAAVLRGANVFAPGVMGLEKGTKHGDLVSVYADAYKSCKRGLPDKYNCHKKVFLGNGILRMVRRELFGENAQPKGVAIEMTNVISACPNISERVLPVGFGLLQNIPSIVCGYILNPKSGEVVLDMCAAPGNKTTHLAALMQNKGRLIALDHSARKIKKLEETCENFGLQNVKVYLFNAKKSCATSIEADVTSAVLPDEPPYPPECFDKILLDTPCSALGKRPQLLNTITDKEVGAFLPLQKRIFKNAVHLLKPGGHLVYSTCSITLSENEGIVAWALETFDCLELLPAEPMLGGSGWPGTTLTSEQLKMVQRFGPEQQTDSVGFFIAHFTKKIA